MVNRIANRKLQVLKVLEIPKPFDQRNILSSFFVRFNKSIVTWRKLLENYFMNDKESNTFKKKR